MLPERLCVTFFSSYFWTNCREFWLGSFGRHKREGWCLLEGSSGPPQPSICYGSVSQTVLLSNARSDELLTASTSLANAVECARMWQLCITHPLLLLSASKLPLLSPLYRDASISPCVETAPVSPTPQSPLMLCLNSVINL